MKTESIQSNREFAKDDPIFREACAIAEVEPTKRQASKFRRRTGAAWNVRGRVKVAK